MASSNWKDSEPARQRNVLEMRDIKFSYEDVPVIESLELIVRSGGEIVCILGPSGVGKTTLLHLALGTQEPHKGTIFRQGKILPVFQNFEAMLLPWFVVRRNITWGLDGHYNNFVERITKLLEIEEKLDALPAKLSGGQKQRVVFARALVRKPDLILLDEPFSSVDAGTQQRMFMPLRELLREEQISTIWITHNIQEAVMIADRILVLKPAGFLREVSIHNLSSRSIAQAIVDELLMNTQS